MARFGQLRHKDDLLKWAVRLTADLERLPSKGIQSSGTVTLAAGATTTIKADGACRKGLTVHLTPATANAATALATTYPAAVNDGSFTLSHATGTSADRTFFYLVV